MWKSVQNCERLRQLKKNLWFYYGVLNAFLWTLSSYISRINQSRGLSSTPFEKKNIGDDFWRIFIWGHRDTNFGPIFTPPGGQWFSSLFPFECWTARLCALILSGDIGAENFLSTHIYIKINVKIAIFSINARVCGPFGPILTLSISDNYSEILFSEKSILSNSVHARRSYLT